MYRVLNIIFRKPVRVFGLGVRETFAEVEREFLQPPVYIILRFLFFFFFLSFCQIQIRVFYKTENEIYESMK